MKIPFLLLILFFLVNPSNAFDFLSSDEPPFVKVKDLNDQHMDRGMLDHTQVIIDEVLPDLAFAQASIRTGEDVVQPRLKPKTNDTGNESPAGGIAYAEAVTSWRDGFGSYVLQEM